MMLRFLILGAALCAPELAFAQANLSNIPTAAPGSTTALPGPGAPLMALGCAVSNGSGGYVVQPAVAGSPCVGASGGGGTVSGTVTANQGTAGSAAWPVVAAPIPGNWTPCQNAAASITVGTTVSTICAAPSGGPRYAYRVTQNGAGTVYCTDDGTTPTATHNTDTMTIAAAQIIYSSPQMVSQGPVQCVGSAAGIALTADAVQTGAP